MHDVFVLYNRPDDPAAFDAHYSGTHVPLVYALPELVEFIWGKPSSEDAPYYVIARMTYADEATANASFASEAGAASVADLGNFAGAGAAVVHVPRIDTSAAQGLSK